MDPQVFQKLKAEVTAIHAPDKALFVYYAITMALGVVTLPFLVPLYFHYHTLKYSFDEDGISMSYGVFLRREMHLTYARVQDIHLSQNIIERWLGIGTVRVQTAGGGSGGDLEIVGTKQFEQIRDYLYARLRGVHDGPAALAAPAGAPAGDRTDALLGQIRDELHAAAAALAKRGQP
jgi:putative membrane protein